MKIERRASIEKPNVPVEIVGMSQRQKSGREERGGKRGQSSILDSMPAMISLNLHRIQRQLSAFRFRIRASGAFYTE
jgi:hypothetical protein